MSIQTQVVNPDTGVYILDTSGESFSLTQEQVRSYFLTAGMAYTEQWIKDQATAALGADVINPQAMMVQLLDDGTVQSIWYKNLDI